MKDTKIIMGMPITVEICDETKPSTLKECFDYFKEIDERYSTYKDSSEVSRLNAGEPIDNLSKELKFVLGLCEKAKTETKGYFNIKKPDGTVDPSGLVKGWAVQNASNALLIKGFNNFYIEAGGDVQASGHNPENKSWSLGIRNPFNVDEVIKVLKVSNVGVATSGSYIRGQHIYNPLNDYSAPQGVASITVIGPEVYHADRYATAAYAMGEQGIAFIEELEDYEGYMVNDQGIATLTSEFEKYVD